MLTLFAGSAGFRTATLSSAALPRRKSRHSWTTAVSPAEKISQRKIYGTLPTGFVRLAPTKKPGLSRIIMSGRRPMLQLTQALRRLLPTVILLPILAIAVSTDLRAQQSVEVGAAEIGGVVASSKGPEAGVWVIAETTELPTKFARIVVTDDQGRYLIPDLPTANYSVWVRGYGLV